MIYKAYKFLNKSFQRIINNFGGKKLKPRKIKVGPLRGFYYYGNYAEGRYFNNFEKDMVDFLSSRIKNRIKEGFIIYDIGACLGFYSLLFAKLIRGNGKVYSFEPNYSIFERLLLNIKLNNFGSSIVPLNIALGEKKTRGELVVLPNNVGRSTLHPALKNQYKSTDKFIQKVNIECADNLNIPRPDFVKIDVEGFETNVLMGMLGILSKNAPDLFIEIHGVGKSGKEETLKKVLSILQNYGYYCINIEHNYYFEGFNSNIPLEGHLYASVDRQHILDSLK